MSSFDDDSAAAPNEAVIRATGVGKVFHDGERVLHILRDTNLAVMPGESVAILGRSGTGKTTLLNILGLLDRPSAGQVLLRSYDTGQLSESQRTKLRGRAIGFIFQQHYLLHDFTALENVTIAGAFGLRREGRERAEDLLTAVGLQDRLGHKPGKLSGGEQQRVAIARALMCRPALLLCDEPTGNLDPETGAEVLEIFWGLVQKQQTALVLVTHDTQVAARADRVLTLAEGELHARS